jgi:hypothetical protein
MMESLDLMPAVSPRIYTKKVLVKDLKSPAHVS